MPTQTEMRVIDLGLVAFDRAQEFQKKIVKDVIEGRSGATLITCEHPPVITYGRRSNRMNILADEATLKRAEVSVCFADRGGDVTFHGPGQLVLYPIIDLREHGKDLDFYLRCLEQAVIDALRQNFGLNAYRRAYQTGVWVGPSKVASIGVGVKHWVTYHGLAVNIMTNMDYFRLIRPCGMDVQMGSLLSFFQDEDISFVDIRDLLVQNIKKIFGYETQDETPSW
jgi:lipoate-protein ligase B